MNNKALYRAIWRAFNEEPHIVNEGASAVITLPMPTVSFAPVETKVPARNIDGGEQYTVNCPFCGDKRHRLYFSYLWNQVIKRGEYVYRCSDHLVRCFNEECQRDREKFEELRSRVLTCLSKPDDDLEYSETFEAPKPESIANQAEMPAMNAPISRSGVPDFIKKYCANRGWSRKELAERWDVRVGLPDYPLAKGEERLKHPIIIVPVTQFGNFWWWQGRLVPLNGELDGDLETKRDGSEYSKYYIPHGAKKRWTLYNLDRALQHDEIGIVEGVTDCWSIGENCVCPFGKTLSTNQLAVLRDRAKGKKVVLIPDMDDPEALELAENNADILRSFRVFNEVSISKLPSGFDPGDLIRKVKKGEIWRYVRSRIASQAVSIFTAGINPAGK